MAAGTRDALAAAAMSLATAVKGGDVVAVKAATIAQYAANFAGIEAAIRTTTDAVKGETPEVRQVYLLDASMRQPGDTNESDFTCALKNSTSETDFAIPALPPGLYAFAMVEMYGERPWVLSFLLEQEGGSWKMAGFYPHARTAAKRDGVAYWKAARASVQGKQPWLAWMYFNLADELLRPADFVTSTQLDKLRAEEHQAAPPELSDGIDERTPLVVKDKDGGEFHFTSMSSEAATDGVSLHLVLHYGVDGSGKSAEADKARNMAAATAMIAAHRELRAGYSAVVVFADTPQQAPSVLLVPMDEIPEPGGK